MTLENVSAEMELEFSPKPIESYGQLDPLFSSARTGDSSKDTWGTPVWLFDLLNQEFNFTVDVAASAENAKVDFFFTEADDGLAQDWHGVAFCNPPYSQSSKWIEKGYKEALAGRATVVMLVGGRPDTSYWWDWARHGEVRFLPGRLRFVGAAKGGAPFPSAVLVFRKGMDRSPATLYWDVHDPNKRRRKKREE